MVDTQAGLIHTVSTSNALGARKFMVYILAIGCNASLPYHTNHKFPVMAVRIQQHVYTYGTTSELFLGTDHGMVLSLFTVCTGPGIVPRY